MNREDRLIGLAMKAGKMSTGSNSCVTSIRDGKAKLVLLACDASENTKKQIQDKCSFYDVPLFFHLTKTALGRLVGKEERSAIAVTEEGFAQAIIGILDSEKRENQEQ